MPQQRSTMLVYRRNRNYKNRSPTKIEAPRDHSPTYRPHGLLSKESHVPNTALWTPSSIPFHVLGTPITCRKATPFTLFSTCKLYSRHSSPCIVANSLARTSHPLQTALHLQEKIHMAITWNLHLLDYSASSSHTSLSPCGSPDRVPKSEPCLEWRSKKLCIELVCT